jgi:hypothetical protein
MVLPSNMVGKLMFERSVKPNQGQSNQIKPDQTISSAETRVDMGLTAEVFESQEMGRFEATLLEW